MRLKKRRRAQATGWKAIRRCVMFFIAVCVVPVVLVLLVASENFLRPVPQSYIHHQLEPSGIRLAQEPVLSHNMSLVAARLTARRKHLKKICRYLGLDKPGNDTLHKPNPWEFLVNSKYHLVWCNVFKAASTSWMYNFNILAGYSPKFLKKSKLVPMTLARHKYPRPSLESLKKAFNDSISFLITRHPLERLLSAYRDKLQYALPHTYHRKLGNDIITKYRKQVKGEKLVTQRWPTFPEFVEFLIDSVKIGERLDMHWTPIVEFCTPCMFDFQIIAHTETLQDDQKFLIKKAHIGHLIEPQWKNAGRGTTSNHVNKYYSQLTRSQILHLHHIYRFDFELFNYSIQGYLEIGKPDKDPSKLLDAITMKDFQKNSMPQVY